MYQLSVIVPGIRNENWIKLYKSVATSFSGTWEIIFVGPYDLPEELQDKDNVSFFKCMRSPIASQQIGLIEAKGELISWAADDGFYMPGALDIAYKTLENEPYTTLITGKYFEGDNPQGMNDEWYYTLSNHDSMKLAAVPEDCKMLNCGLVYKSLLTILGGWDAARFQVCPMSYTDFAIRAYRHGCKFILQPEVMFKCSHEPGMTGTHGPIHIAQTEYDEYMFRGIYSDPKCSRRAIDINNWKLTAEVWPMRSF